jgi:hypothetical protein
MALKQLIVKNPFRVKKVCDLRARTNKQGSQSVQVSTTPDCIGYETTNLRVCGEAQHVRGTKTNDLRYTV